MNIALWIVQALLALAFLAAGIPKATQPIDTLAKRMSFVKHFSPTIVRLIGICEILGAIGLIVPPLTHILPWLAIAAAVGLGIIMVGAIVYHISQKEYPPMSATGVLLILAILIIVGRITFAPHFF